MMLTIANFPRFGQISVAALFTFVLIDFLNCAFTNGLENDTRGSPDGPIAPLLPPLKSARWRDPVVRNARSRRSVGQTRPECPPLKIKEPDIEMALESGFDYTERVDRLENELFMNGTYVDMGRITTDGRHQVAPAEREYVKELHDNHQVFEEATRVLARNLSLAKDQIGSMRQVSLESVHVRRVRQVCDFEAPILSCFQSKYRTADGSCNNLLNPLWGKSFSCLGRLLDPDYGDGISMPRISHTGKPLPNPRVLSTVLHAHRDRRATFTQLLMNWGQFLLHDISFTPLVQTASRQAIQCCPRMTHPECFPIPIPHNDPFYAQFGQRCMNFVRSTTCSACMFGPRQQLTTITSFIDASNVYGNLLNESLTLRTLDGTGRLLVSYSRHGTPLLPLSMNGNDQCSQRRQSLICFRSGDVRVNQQPPLTALHTIVVRQHNRIAAILGAINPHWDEERLFQETRRIIGAQMQVIAFKEYLPVILGEDAMKYYKLNVLEDDYTHYDSELEPAILSEFSTAAFRFGHSLVHGVLSRISASGISTTYNLRDFFFIPFDLYEGKIDSILRGLVGRLAQKFDPFVHGDVRNHLYKPRGDAFGTDLAAFNINRGRDHGITGYTKYLKYCFDEEIHEFEQLDQYMPPAQRMKFEQLYASVDDIDLFSGGLSEYPLEGALVGPTFSCIIGIQFHHLKYGDRFYFEHGGQSGSFTPSQLQSLRQTTLAKIICENGDHFDFIHLNVFQRESLHDPIRSCHEIPDLDFAEWRDFHK